MVCLRFLNQRCVGIEGVKFLVDLSVDSGFAFRGKILLAEIHTVHQARPAAEWYFVAHAHICGYTFVVE